MNFRTELTSDLYVETWGDGSPVVLVHGSLAVGNEEWAEQRPLVDQGFRLTVFDRRGNGLSPSGGSGEDFLVDADDIADLLGNGAHLIGHSYGGLSAMIAAARRPQATRSLTLLEPALTKEVGTQSPEWCALVDEITSFWYDDLDDRTWVIRFLKAVGSDPDQFPPEMLAAALPLVPTFRNGRPFYEAQLPLAELQQAGFPKLVVSGGHHPGFDGMCRDLAARIGGDHRIVEGAGHEIQFTGQPLNELLIALWQRADQQ